MEERYSSLQEEVQGKTRKLRKVWTLLHSAKSEVEDMKQEHQREMESLLEGVRQLTKELKLSTFIVDEYIPAQYQVNSLETNLFFFLRWTVFFFLFMQETIEQHVNWSEEYGEWQVKGVAYAGNNINQYKSPRSSAKSNYVSQFTFFFFFLKEIILRLDFTLAFSFSLLRISKNIVQNTMLKNCYQFSPK